MVTEADLAKGGAGARADAVVIKDRIADSMFQQLLLRPDEYSVIATPNLNGDYMSDAAAAQVGGLGIAPGGNVGDGVAVFEATHGTAPKYANLDKINPGSVILSGVMMFEYLGWNEAATLIVRGLENAIKSRRVTYDLARQMPGATEVSTSAFGDQIIKGMTRLTVAAPARTAPLPLMTLSLNVAAPDFGALDTPLLVVALAERAERRRARSARLDARSRRSARPRARAPRFPRRRATRRCISPAATRGVQRVLLVGMGTATDRDRRAAARRRASRRARRTDSASARLAFFAGALTERRGRGGRPRPGRRRVGL